MARHSVSGTTVAALANGNAIASIVPAVASNFKLLRVVLACITAGNTPTDFQIGVGVNRGTARGTSSGTATINKFDPLSAVSGITAVDNAWSIQPTLAAADAQTFAFNSRGGVDLPYGSGSGADDFASTVGVANVIVLVQRSGAALPANHSIAWTIEFED